MTSLAAIFDGRAISLGHLPTPDPRDGEILARVLGCTICGSDRHSVEGRRVVPVPTVLGHEIVGEVAAFGPSTPEVDATGHPLRIGDRITWAIVAHCGACEFCRADLPQKCERGVKYGHEAFRPGQELRGGLAEHCLLAPGTTIVRLPDDLPLEVACPAGCATATVAAAMEAAVAIRGRRVLVLGAGMLGLTACAWAHSAGALAVICADPSHARRDLARKFGASQAVGPGEFGEIDVVLELSGDPDAIEQALPRLRIGGVMVLVGTVFPTQPVPIRPEQVVRRCLTIRGIHNYGPRHLIEAIRFLSAHHGHYPFDQLVDRWFPLERTAEAFSEGVGKDAIRIGVRRATSVETGSPAS